MFSNPSDLCLYNLFRKQITATNYIFLTKIYIVVESMIVQVQVHVYVYVHKPEFSVDIVLLDHADVGDPFHFWPRKGWKSDAKMYLSADRS